MRLQLIRYESVELTEQLMRERQKRQAEEGDHGSSHNEDEELEEETAAAAASEVQVQLRGVLLEEQRTEELTVSTGEEGQEDGMLYVLAGGLSQAGKDSVMLQLQDATQQQGM